DLSQRSIVHVDGEHSNAAASTYTKPGALGVSADIRVQPASRPLIGAQSGGGQRRSREREKFTTGRFLSHNLCLLRPLDALRVGSALSTVFPRHLRQISCRTAEIVQIIAATRDPPIHLRASGFT